MKNAPRNKKGFTLVEILIVVIILGILAAIVVPQFTNASDDARKSSLASQLQTLRNQVSLYKLHHRETYPNNATNANGSALVTDTWTWSKMTTKTDEFGKSDPAGAFGPYLQSVPTNSINGFSTVGTAPAAGVGFVIDANGKLFATGKVPTAWYNEGQDAAKAVGDDTDTVPTDYTAAS